MDTDLITYLKVTLPSELPTTRNADLIARETVGYYRATTADFRQRQDPTFERRQLELKKEMVNFSPLSAAAFGAIFPAAAFFPSTCTEGTSVPAEEVEWSSAWIPFLPG